MSASQKDRKPSIATLNKARRALGLPALDRNAIVSVRFPAHWGSSQREHARLIAVGETVYRHPQLRGNARNFASQYRARYFDVETWFSHNGWIVIVESTDRHITHDTVRAVRVAG